MQISDEVKKKIKEEYESWVNVQYGSKSKEERQKLGQFFTPPQLTIKMLEKFDDLNGNILDPTVGARWTFSSSNYCWCGSKKVLRYRA